jgi:tellurite resistance protein
LSNAPAGLPPLPTPPESEEPENVIKVELPSPSMPKVISIDGNAVADRAEADEIRVVMPGTISQEGNGEGKPAEEAVVADQPAPALTDEQQFVLSLSPHENLTIIEGCSFLPMSVAMADGVVDQNEEECLDIVQEKFIALFQSGDAATDEQFDTEYNNNLKETETLDTFRSEFIAAQDEAETERLVTNFMADFAKVLDKAPESVSVKIKNYIRESCLEVAEASGEGAGANICGAEAFVIGELLRHLEIDLDEETASRIFSSLETLDGLESAELQVQHEQLIQENEALRFLHNLDEEQRKQFWFGLIVCPALVAVADGIIDEEEQSAAEWMGEELDQKLIRHIFNEEEVGFALVVEVLYDLEEGMADGIHTASQRSNELLHEGSALERGRKADALLADTKSILDQAPEDLQQSLKEWILNSCLDVAEASGSQAEGDDLISIEERQIIVTIFRQLGINYADTPLEERLNIDPEGQDFRGYLSTLNATDRIRLLALPHVLVEIVAAADGKIDSQEAMQIVPILKEESAALDAEFPVIWRGNLREVQQYGKGLSAEFQSLQGSPRKQLEWVFSLLDDYWKILDTMPTELQAKFKTAIANIVTRIAEVSGEGNSVASNIGVEEQLLIDIIHESLGIQSCN